MEASQGEHSLLSCCCNLCQTWRRVGSTWLNREVDFIERKYILSRLREIHAEILDFQEARARHASRAAPVAEGEALLPPPFHNPGGGEPIRANPAPVIEGEPNPSEKSQATAATREKEAEQIKEPKTKEGESSEPTPEPTKTKEEPISEERDKPSRDKKKHKHKKEKAKKEKAKDKKQEEEKDDREPPEETQPEEEKGTRADEFLTETEEATSPSVRAVSPVEEEKALRLEENPDFDREEEGTKREKASSRKDKRKSRSRSRGRKRNKTPERRERRADSGARSSGSRPHPLSTSGPILGLARLVEPAIQETDLGGEGVKKAERARDIAIHGKDPGRKKQREDHYGR